VKIEGNFGDEFVFLGTHAEVLVALERAVVTGSRAGSRFIQDAGAGAAAFRVIAAFALGQRREFALAVGLDAEVEEGILEKSFADGVVAHFRVVDLLLGEPAAGRHVGGGRREGLAEAFALLLVEILVVTPGGLVAATVSLPISDGADGVAVGAGEGFRDGLVEDELRAGGRGGRWTRESHGGDLEGEEGFSGAPGVEDLGEEAVGDLGRDDADSGQVFEEGNGDPVALGADGEAVASVRDAEVPAALGALVAGAAEDGEGAAAAELGFGGLRGGIGHWFSFGGGCRA